MAAPESVTLKDLTGSYTMNKQESDQFDPVLQLQGISWVTRTAIGMMTVTLNVKQYVDNEGITHIDIDQLGAAGIKGTSERRILHGEWNEHQDHIFGAIKGRSKWTQLSALSDSDEDEKFLKSKWDQQTQEGEVIESYAESLSNGWIARQIWGFQDVNGVRKYTRNIVVKKGDDTRMVTLHYDYKELKE